jgi:hypothetical protein
MHLEAKSMSAAEDSLRINIDLHVHVFSINMILQNSLITQQDIIETSLVH